MLACHAWLLEFLIKVSEVPMRLILTIERPFNGVFERFLEMRCSFLIQILRQEHLCHEEVGARMRFILLHDIGENLEGVFHPALVVESDCFRDT